MNRLWQIYKTVEFEFGQPLSSKLNFAIITAHNPRGELCSAGKNALLDRLLQKDITSMSVPYRSLVGRDQHKKHQEKSWAIPIEKADAILLAKTYQQNALYWVENDKLYLVPVLMCGVEEEFIGSFSQKVKSIQEHQLLATK